MARPHPEIAEAAAPLAEAAEKAEEYARKQTVASERQKEARQQNEGCQLIPNGDLDKQKTERDSSIMKGLVF